MVYFPEFLKLTENEPSLRRYAKSFLIWNPLIVLSFVLSMGNFGTVAERFLYSITVASVVSTCCFAFESAALAVRLRWRDWRSLPPRTASRSLRFALALAAMPAGLYAGFWTAALATPLFRLPEYKIGWVDYRYGLFMGTVIAGIYLLFYSRFEARQDARRAQVIAQAAERERLRAQLSSLTAQMNPHLLFNSLNTVASLIASDPAEAENVIVHLADLYRGVLDSSQSATHPLARELQICESYLLVERARFGERLRVRLEVAPGLDAAITLVPTLCLQPLVENAVKHGLAPRPGGGEIVISARLEGRRLCLKVEDDGVGLDVTKNTVSGPSKSGSGTGLRNSRARMELHFPTTGIFSVGPRPGGGTSVRLEFTPETLA